MRDDEVSRLEMSDELMEREADVFVSEREMRDETEMSSEFPEIFMSVRLRVPSVSREKTEEEVNDVSMETVKLLREIYTPSTLKKDALPDVIFNVTSLVVVTGASETVAAFVVRGEIVRSFPVTARVGVSLSCSPSVKRISWLDVWTSYAFLMVWHGRSLHPQWAKSVPDGDTKREEAVEEKTNFCIGMSVSESDGSEVKSTSFVES